MDIEFLEAIHGGDRKLSYTRYDTCKKCDGQKK